MTADPLQAWLTALAPGRGPGWAKMLHHLPRRPTFEDLPLWPRDGDRPHPLASTEFSLREVGGDARWAFTLDPERLPRGWLTAALRALTSGAAELAPRAEAWANGGVGMLIGVDHDPAGDRGKLYLYPDRGRPPAQFEPVYDAAMTAAGVDPAFARDRQRAVDRPLVFIAVDLLAAGPSGAKLYLSPHDHRDAADRLGRLGQPALAHLAADLPDAVDLDPHSVVITLRARGQAIVDTTLHARCHRLGDIAARAGDALWDRWEARQAAAAALGLRLHPTHLSWSSPGLGRTMYYMVGPHSGADGR